MEITQIELMVYQDQGYSKTRGVGQPQADRCALACAFLAKTTLKLITTKALIERLQSDSRLRRLCGFDLRKSLPGQATFSRAFAQFASSQLAQRVHERMVKEHLSDQLIGHISRDATAIASARGYQQRSQSSQSGQGAQGQSAQKQAWPSLQRPSAPSRPNSAPAAPAHAKPR